MVLEIGGKMKYKEGEKVIVLPTILDDGRWKEDARNYGIVGKIVTITGLYEEHEDIYLVNDNVYGINFREEHLAYPVVTNWRKHLKCDTT